MVNYEQLSPQTRVWIYQSNREFTQEEMTWLVSQINDFVPQWTSHNQALKSWGTIKYNRFLVLMVDESQAMASGCSIDKSVAFVQSIEQKLNINMFDRLDFAYKANEHVNSAQKDQFAQFYQAGKINAKTTVFNNLVKTKAEFEEKWEIALGDSWHKNFV